MMYSSKAKHSRRMHVVPPGTAIVYRCWSRSAHLVWGWWMGAAAMGPRCALEGGERRAPLFGAAELRRAASG